MSSGKVKGKTVHNYNEDLVPSNKKNKLLIFDMDGVLIDVSSSYRETVRYVVAIFFRNFLGIESFERNTISLQEVADIKTLGGLNNDWDLTSSIINSCLYYLAKGRRFHLEKIETQGSGWGWKRENGLSLESPYVDKNLLAHLTGRKKEGIFVDVYKKWKNEDGFVYVKGDGEVVGEDIVKRIFQEVYLGKELFKKNYLVDPEYYTGEGLIDRETLIPECEFLFRLKRDAHLAIATGRPRDEAVYPLKKFGIYEAFEYLITEDEIQEAGGEHLRKPDPFSIIMCIENFPGVEPENIYYIGDMPDDMIAARKAGVVPVGFVNTDRGGSQGEVKGDSGSISARNFPVHEGTTSDDELIERHINRLYRCGAGLVLTRFDEILKLLN